jgi:cytochrome oxidase Cu insertion factor (SCO1/SenC/PrrC family)
VKPRAAALLLAACAAVGVGGGFALHELVRPAATTAAPTLPELHGQVVWAAGKRPAPPFALHDQSGRLVTSASLRGRPVLLTFLDSQCKSRCPIAGRQLAWAVRGLPQADRPEFVVVSVNPKDTWLSVRAAASHWAIPSGFEWLMGTSASLAPVWKQYGITVEPRTHDVLHSLAVYLLDRNGDERAGYLFPFQPGFVQGDLRTLARET